jgi:hypothetical protein
MKEDLIKDKELVLISQTEGIRRDANDPLSGVALATYDTVGDIIGGLVAGPVEAAKHVGPRLAKHEEEKLDAPPSVRFSVRQESTPRTSDSDSWPTEPEQASWKPPQPEAAQSWEPRIWSEGKPEPNRLDATLGAAPTAAKNIALETGKGLGRIVGAGLKAPMTVTHGVTRGFHNLPKLYGDDVREYENVTDLKSGLSVSAKVRTSTHV